VAEFLIAFSFAYDWLYDAWNEVERDAIKWSIIDLGLKKGLEAHEQNAWFLSVKGNWNCKCDPDSASTGIYEHRRLTLL